MELPKTLAETVYKYIEAGQGTCEAMLVLMKFHGIEKLERLHREEKERLAGLATQTDKQIDSRACSESLG